MDPERMIISAEASGFPQFMREIFKNLDFEDLLKTRLISMTFYKFLMDNNQGKIWIVAASKVFANFLQKNIENFPDCLQMGFWNTESFQQKWIEVFEKIKDIASIPEVIKICHLLREIENPRKIRKSSMSMQMSLIFSNSLEQDYLMVSFTPNMWAYLHYMLAHNQDCRKREDWGGFSPPSFWPNC